MTRDSTVKCAAVRLAVALLAFGISGHARGADLEALEKKAALCNACHGAQGISSNPVFPTLAGQPKQFVTTQLVMFREGNRRNPLMSPIAADMTNAEINDYGT